MSLQDRFRIDELSKVGSKSVTRDDTVGLSVRKVDNKEVNPIRKEEKPFGSEPIRGKQVVPRLKTDTINPDTTPNPEQQSFSGETTAYAERPIYNEEELQKAVDLKVDELIKQKKLKRGEFVTKQRYDGQVGRVNDLTEQLRLETLARKQAESQIPGLQSTISSLESQLQSLQQELQKKDEAARQLLESFERVVGDLQTAIINGTKEGVERASLAARVQGLGAQRDTLVQAVKTQNETIKTLRVNIESQREGFQALQQQGQAVLETVQTQAERDRQQAELERQRLEEEQRALQSEAARLKQNQKKKIICNELYIQGFLPEELWDADERYGDMMFEKDPRLVIGYQMWARYVVEFMRKNPQYSKYSYMIFKPWTEYMGYEMGVIQKKNWKGYLTHVVGKQISYLVFNLNNGKRLLDLYNYKKFRSSIG